MTDLSIIQREDFLLDLILKTGEPLEAIDLTGATIEAQIREDWNKPKVAEIVAVISEPEAGRISLSLPGDESLKLKPGSYKYDAYLTRDGVTTRILFGSVEIVGAITRP